MQIEATGKSVEIAIQNGLLECGMKREEVEVKIIEKGGLFKKAKVVLSWGEKPAEVVEEKQVEVAVEKETTKEEDEETETVVETEKPEKKKKVVDTAR